MCVKAMASQLPSGFLLVSASAAAGKEVARPCEKDEPASQAALCRLSSGNRVLLIHGVAGKSVVARRGAVAHTQCRRIMASSLLEGLMVEFRRNGT